ncbi:CHAT domain-containing protein [filamentous cyanobacterium LEGE 11480]|uniref:CHAT domain-containing protein n=1 Tax=Romeriopsis navalis LEGE 11480 TaxID=2777977 RepID=A0A928VLZ6_9CYAN|nr:CHAT domain-containing tetratricopeptide repeat protein [Romeriopsis navalis]MBE9028454.1 CHAT domain-containing protein [Romeriopsis navalis LEGE 11480]
MAICSPMTLGDVVNSSETFDIMISFAARNVHIGFALLLLGSPIGNPKIASAKPPATNPPTPTTAKITPQRQALISQAQTLNRKVMQLASAGNYQAAAIAAKAELKLRQQYLGPNHPEVATTLSNLAELHRLQGQYAAATPFYQRSLKIYEIHLGKTHPNVARSLSGLAINYQAQGQYRQAEPLHQRSLAIYETHHGRSHPDVARSLNNLAIFYTAQGQYDKAKPLYQRSLKIRRSHLGETHLDVATSLMSLAELYRVQGLYEPAKPLYQRSLKIYQTQLGQAHPLVAANLNNFALLHTSQGNYTEAAPLYERSLKIYQTRLGKAHPDLVKSLINLASLYTAQGRDKAARSLYQRSLKISEAQLGKSHPLTATNLNNLASVSPPHQAASLYRRSLKIRETKLGKNHPDVAASLHSLATLHMVQGRYQAALPRYQRSLKIRETKLGKNHPDVAASLHSLAHLYKVQGRYGEAESHYQRSLRINQSRLGPEHPSIANNLISLAGIYIPQARYDTATDLLAQGLAIEETNLAQNLALGTEAQKRDYIAQLQNSTNGTISLHLQHAPNHPQATALALTTILRRKGRILDVTSHDRQILHKNLTPANQTLLDQLTSRTTQLAALPYGPLPQTDPKQYRTQLKQLTQQVKTLQTRLAASSKQFRQQIQPVTIAAVQQQLPTNSALIEIIRYQPHQLRAKAGKRFGPARYAAYILNRKGKITTVDLGAAKPIDQLAEEFRRALRSRNGEIKQIARNLDAKLMAPIRQQLSVSNQTQPQHLLIAPDSQLNLIPFAALVDEHQRYLIETYEISYLTSGRDLLRLNQSPPSPKAALLLADPRYDQPGEADSPITAKRRTSQRPISQPPITQSPISQTRSQRTQNLHHIQFGPLPGTAAEAKAIAPQLTQAIVLTGKQATENALKQAASPRILHIATHGFFFDDQPQFTTSKRRGANVARRRSDILPIATSPKQPRTSRMNTENALLRSGLALAGFNDRQSGQEDGVLTALEVANLNLQGTQLVVLSACETGIGDVANGEGVYGLRRALVLAGADSQLISLWKVDDQGTKDLMTQYYNQLIKQQSSRSQALRQVQLAFRKSSKYRHPFFWAAFIPSGDWRTLQK